MMLEHLTSDMAPCTAISTVSSATEILFLRTFALKSSHAHIFFKLATQKSNDILMPKRQKQLGSPTVLERTCPEKYPKSEKSGNYYWFLITTRGSS